MFFAQSCAAKDTNTVFRLADLDGKEGVHVYNYSPTWAHDVRDAVDDKEKTLPSKRQIFAWVDAVVARLATAAKIVPVPDSREEIIADKKPGKCLFLCLASNKKSMSDHTQA